MNFVSIVLAYKMFSLTNFLDCGQDANGPADCCGGPAAIERATHAAQKPCRMNNQFATSAAARQQRHERVVQAKMEEKRRPFETQGKQAAAL
jgi:hypothetical protein